MIEPYYQDASVTLYHADCGELLPALPRFGLLLTDPPYGIADVWKGGAGGKSTWRIAATETHEWDASVSDHVFAAVDKCDDAIVWGGNYYALPPRRCWLVWDKKQNDAWTTGQAELAWSTIERPVRVFRLATCEMPEVKQGIKVHPTQKPLPLIRWCLKWCDAETVLDPFAGSGTTGVAAKLEGRRAVLIEKSERYCELAADRLRQGVLFA